MNNKLSLLVNFVGVDKMSGALRNIIGLGGKGSKSLRALAGDAKKLTREIADYDRQIERTSGNATDLIERQRQAMEQLEQVQRRIAREQRLAAIEADRQAMRRRGTELRSKGAENVAGGVAAAAPLIYAVTKAAEFSSVMVDIQQKAELSDQATKGLANNILLSARAARLLPADMAAAVDTLSGLGLDPKQAVEAAAPMGKFMTAFKVEGTDAAAAVYAGVSNLKIPLAQTAKLLDMMAAGGNQGAFEVRDMAAAFPGLTAQMQALGQTGTRGATELIAMLETIRRGTGDSAAAATNAENLLAKVTSPTTTAAFRKHFGIDLPAAVKKGTAAGVSPIQTLIALTNKATKGDLSKLGSIFEDMQAQSALRQLIIDQKLFLQMQGKIAAAGGLVDKAFNQRVANDATVSWRELMGSAQMVAITLGTTLLPVAKQVIGNLSTAATRVADWAKANPELATTLMQGAAALITFKIGLGAAQIAFGSILGPLGNVIALARQAGPVLGLLRTAFLFLGRGALQAGIMMLGNPIVLAIMAIVAAVGIAAYLIYSNWDRIKAAFEAGVAGVKGFLGTLPAWLRNIGSMMMEGLLLALNPIAMANKLIQVAKYGITAFKNYLGIKSPSRVFMALGGHVAGGLEAGIDQNRHGPARAAGRMASGVMAAGALSPTPFASAARPAAAPAATAQRGGDTYHFHITQQPGEDAEAFARRVQELIDKANDRKRRRGFEDA